MSNNTFYNRPFKDYRPYAWYYIEEIQCEEIGLCICDPPLGDTKGITLGFLSLFKDNSLPNAVILVNDNICEVEQKMIQEWEQ